MLFDNIYGDKVNLIELSLDYLEDMYEYSKDVRLYEFFEYSPQMTLKDTKKYLTNLIKKSNGVDSYWWFIQLKETSQVVGSFGVHDIDLERQECEISYAVSPSYWGKGVFIEALNMALGSLFYTFNFYRVNATTASKNYRSIGALKKVGFQEEGVFRNKMVFSDGRRVDQTTLALLVHQYRITNKFKKIKLPQIEDFNEPIYVENRNFRSKRTDEYFEAAAAEADNIPKIDGLVVDKKLVNFIDCPICRAKDKERLYIKWGFIISLCSNCEHVFVENQLKTSVLKDLYKSSDVDEKFQSRNEEEGLFKYSILLYNKYLQLLNKSFYGDEHWIDIGAGDGMLLDFLSNVSNFKLSAMEFSKKSEVFIKNIVGEENFYDKDISKTNFDNKRFKIITLWGVLEHMPNPVEELSKCNEILDRDGRILILVPNFYSRALKILGVNTPTINPRSHLHYFSYNSFDVLANNCGLQIDEYYQELPIIDLMYDYIDYSDNLVKSILKNNESYYSVYILKHQE